MIAESSADTVVCLALGALMAGKWAKDLSPGLRIIYDNNELQIESIASLPKKVIWNWFQNRGVRACDAVFHAEQNRLEYFREHYHAGQGKEHVLIENFPYLLENSSTPIDPPDEVRVVYLGGFGSSRFTEEIIDAFCNMDPRYRLDIVGFGRPEYVEDIETRLKARNVDHVRILSGIPHSSIPVFLCDYHIGVALYRNTNLNNYYCAPNKIYDYLMNGMPVITNRYPGLVKVVEDNRIGICIDKVNKDEIMRAIELIKSERRWENITPAIRQRYSWEWQQQRYLATFGLGHETALLSNS
jgi:glycosyltransferase involved in cell wall biosynthesis